MKGYLRIRNLFVPMWRRAFAFEVQGTERIPAEGPAILVANHASVVDHFIMAASTERPMVNMAHREAFEHPLGGWFLRTVGAIPIWRKGGDEEALQAARYAIAEGHLLCLYPEGDWTPDGQVHRFHTGAVRLAAMTGAPLIPIGITGSLERRKGTWFRLGGPVGLVVGTPRTVPWDADPRLVSDELQQEVADLAGLQAASAYVQVVA